MLVSGTRQWVAQLFERGSGILAIIFSGSGMQDSSGQALGRGPWNFHGCSVSAIALVVIRLAC